MSPHGITRLSLKFEAVREDRPGPKWTGLFRRLWPAYRRWYLAQGIEGRPSARECRREFRKCLPGLWPTYERLGELLGSTDLTWRFLSLYRPPAFMSGCSQAVWTRGEPFLIRNYDYQPTLSDGVVLCSKWNGRRVIAVSDCGWGAVDGMNDSGLAVSITFGGRPVVGEGFGIPVIVRAMLELCDTVEEACELLQELPCHMSYNLTMLDRNGRYSTALISPDRPLVLLEAPIATNHQIEVEWHDYARVTETVQRERHLQSCLYDASMTAQEFTRQFMRPPVYCKLKPSGYGTLYTAIYRPTEGKVEFRWPGSKWIQSFDNFQEGQREVDLSALSHRVSMVN